MKREGEQKFRWRMPRRGVFVFLFMLFAMAAPFDVRAADVSKEYQLKAVLLFRLTQFVEWPADVFATTNSPVVIGILGENPFGSAVEIAARGETAHTRPIEVRYLREANEAADCHVLYICRSERARLREILRVVQEKSVLTVSDIENFATEPGEAVRFMSEENKIGLRINLEATKAAKLSVDARLLRMAQVTKK